MSSTTNTSVAHVWRPSRARYLALEGFVPVPRGAVATMPATPSWPAKDPGDVLDYEYDVSAALAGNANDVIAVVTAQITPSGQGDLTADRIVADGALVVIWLSGGHSGTVYMVQINIETASGRTLNRSVFLPVISASNGVPPATALVTEQGLVVTDQNGSPILVGS